MLQLDQRRARDAVAAFANAAKTGDLNALLDALAEVESVWAWKPALRACGRPASVPPQTQEAFLDLWIAGGETSRSNVGNDLILLNALKILLPPYKCGAVPLFRGEGVGNHERRTYGMSWSAVRSLAEQYAANRADRYQGSTVLVETLAPPEAILSAPALLLPGDENGERSMSWTNGGLVRCG
jgi:hypothetical protein